MTFLNENSILLIREQTEKALQAMASGKSIRDIMVDIYIAGLPEKTETQGRLMADHIIDLVAGFTADCDAALQDADHWLEGKLEAMLEGKNMEERCQLLFQLNNAFTVINASTLGEQMRDATISAEDIAASLSDKELNPAAVSAELADELKRQVLEAVKNCGIVFTQLDKMADMLEQAGEHEDLGRCIVDFGIRTADFKALAAMTAYVAAKNGTLEDVPLDISLNEITISVCAALEIQRVAAQVAEGSLAEDIARVLIRIIGMAAAWLIIFKMFAIVLAAGSLVLHGMLGCIACVLLAVSVVYTVGKVVFNMAAILADITTDVGSAVVKTVVSGLRKLASWVCETVLPALAHSVERTFAFVSDLFAKGMAIVTGTNRERERVAVRL